MQTTKISSKPLEKKDYSSINSKLIDHSTFKDNKQIKKPLTQRKNPEEQQQEIRSIVKQYLKGKNIEELKNKFYSDRLIKKRNRISIDLRKSIQLRKSIDYNKETQNQKNIPNYTRNGRHMSLVQADSKGLNNFEQKSKIMNNFNDQCQKFKQCNCGAHYCQTNQIKIKFRDPISKFQSNYTIDTKQAKSKSKSHIQRPQITADYFSTQLQQVPQYSPKFDSLNVESSYQSNFLNLQPRDKLDSFKHLKLSNVNFGPKEVKGFQSSYQQQYSQQNKDKYAKTPQPFVVKEQQNLNAFGMKYHGINSNYQKQYEAKKNGQRDSLKPLSLFKDLNLYLVKQSNYKQAYSQRTQQIKTSIKNRLNKDKIPVVHHLSSSFIPLDGIFMDDELIRSSYKKDFVQQKTDLNKYLCPNGYKSSNGAISKY